MNMPLINKTIERDLLKKFSPLLDLFCFFLLLIIKDD